MCIRDSITTIVATPHVIPGSHTLDEIHELKERIQELKQLAQKQNIKVFEGCLLYTSLMKGGNQASSLYIFYTSFKTSSNNFNNNILFFFTHFVVTW